MWSRQVSKYIRSLQQKKSRDQEKRFIVEGEKSVLEVLFSDFACERLVCTKKFLDSNPILSSSKIPAIKSCEINTVSETELSAMSSLKSNSAALVVAKIKTAPVLKEVSGLQLVLDDIQDPGNLGTLLRLADWFGLSQIVASKETADFYNSKVLQASMGSFTRVAVIYTDLSQYLSSIKSKQKTPIYSANKNGEPIHRFQFEKNCVLILGNESQGISKDLQRYSNYSVAIPGYGKAESLNVALAAAIFCDHYAQSHLS